MGNVQQQGRGLGEGFSHAPLNQAPERPYPSSNQNPNSENPSAISACSALKSHLKNPNRSSVSAADNSTRAKIRILVDADGEAFTRIPTPCPLPDDIVIKNRAFAKKLLAGLVDPVTGEELPDASAPSSCGGTRSPSPTSFSCDEIGDTNAASADLTSPNAKPSTTEIPSASSADSASIPVPIPPLSPEDLAAQVNHYTIRRAAEYVAYSRNIDPWPHRTPPPKFITEDRHCPCGHACPCPHHETPEKGGPFPDEFWSLSPFGFAYSDHLFARDLPYRLPTEYLA